MGNYRPLRGLMEPFAHISPTCCEQVGGSNNLITVHYNHGQHAEWRQNRDNLLPPCWNLLTHLQVRGSADMNNLWNVTYYTLTTCAVCELGTWFKEILGMTCWTIPAINTIISTGWRLNCILFACCHQVTHVYWRTFWITTNIAKLEVEQQVGGSAEALCPPIIRNHINT